MNAAPKAHQAHSYYDRAAEEKALAPRRAMNVRHSQSRSWAGFHIRGFGRFRRLAALGYIPEAKAQIGAFFRGALIEFTAVVLAIGSDRVDDDAVIQSAIPQRRRVKGIEGHLWQVRGNQVGQRFGPAVIRPPVT